MLRFLTPDAVLVINQALVALTGEARGLLSRGLLESACAQAEWSYEYGGGAFEIAAAYAYHLVPNHAFVNGNKRTAAAVADIFLTANGFAFNPPPDEYAALIEDTVMHQAGKPELAAFFRLWCGG